MYYFQFNNSKSLNHDPNQKYSVYEAIKYMNDVHRDRQTIEKPVKVKYTISDEKGEDIISDALLLGQQSSFDFFQHTASRYRHLFSNDEETLIQLNKFLDELERQYERELIEKYEVTSFTDEELKKPMPDIEPSSIEQRDDEDLKDLEPKKAKEPKKGKEKPKKVGSKTPIKKEWKVVIVAIVASLTVFLLSRQVVSSDEEVQAPDYDTLIAEASYLEALDYYPENIDEIEREIFLQGQDGQEDLQALVNAYPDYQPGQFDLAYLNQDYPRVIELKETADSPGRKAQLAIAHINQGQLEEAEALNQELNSSDIADLIRDAYFEKTITAIKNNDLETAQSYQEKVNDKQLDQTIESLEKINQEIEDLEKENNEENKDKVQKLKEESERIKSNL